MARLDRVCSTLASLVEQLRYISNRKWNTRCFTKEGITFIPSRLSSSRNFHQLEDVGTDADYDKARDKLTAYFEPQKNQRYEVYKFRQTRQEEGETLDKFHTRLRNLSSNCEFTNPDFESSNRF